MEGGRVPTQIKLYVSVGEMDESIMELVLYFLYSLFFFKVGSVEFHFMTWFFQLREFYED